LQRQLSQQDEKLLQPPEPAAELRTVELSREQEEQMARERAKMEELRLLKQQKKVEAPKESPVDQKPNTYLSDLPSVHVKRGGAFVLDTDLLKEAERDLLKVN